MRYQMILSALLGFLGAKPAHSAGIQWELLSHTRDILSINAEGNDVWVGTGGGLIRMDKSTGRIAETHAGPMEMEVYEGRRIGTVIKRIEPDGDKGIWILTGRRIWRVVGTTWSATGKHATSLLKASDGTIFACGRDSLLFFRNGSWGGVSLEMDDRYGWVSKSHLAVSKADRVWAYAQWGGDDIIFGYTLIEFDLKAGKIVRKFGGPGSGPGSAWKALPDLNEMVIDSAGTLWGGGGMGLYRMTDTGMDRIHSERISDIVALQADHSGGLWAAKPQGVYHLSGQTGNVEYLAGPMDSDPNARIQTLSMDAEGVLWVGTMMGLESLSGEIWKTWKTSNVPLPSNLVAALAPDPDGGMWIGSGSDLIHLRDTVWKFAMQSPPGNSGYLIVSLAVHENGAVWGLSRYAGIFRFMPAGDGATGKLTWYNSGFSPHLIPALYDIAIAPSISGFEVVWAVGDGGLLRIQGDAVERIPNPAGGMPNGRKFLAVDSLGRVWLATSKWLLSFDGSQWRNEMDTRLMDLIFDSAGRLWGLGDSAFHWMEAGVWRKHPFPPYTLNEIKSMDGLAHGPGGAIIFKHQSGSTDTCGRIHHSFPSIRMGIVTPDTVRCLEMELPGGAPFAMTYDKGGRLWLGTENGLAISMQRDIVSIGRRDAKGYLGGQKAARFIPPDEWDADGRRLEDSFDLRGRRGKTGTGLRAEIPAATGP